MRNRAYNEVETETNVEGGTAMQHKKNELFSQIEAYIYEYKEKTGGASPTVRDIAYACNTSPSSVSRYMNTMKAEGKIDFVGHRNIITKDENVPSTVKVPVLGRVSCGLPLYAEENIEEYVKLPTSMFGNGEYYMLRAVGESMINIGIADGDYVLIRAQNTAGYNQVVVALVDGEEATLKRFRPEEDRIILHPENDTMEDIVVDNCIIQGVAVKAVKDIF